jgi:O-antigen/teichoic acid export membrane protein
VEKSVSTRPAFAVLIGSGVLTQAIMFLAALVLARLYDPVAFGDLGLYTGIGALMAVISGLRYDHIAYSQPPYRRDSLYLVSYLVCVAILLLSALVFFLLEIFIDKTGYSAYWSLAFCLCSSIFYLNTQYLISIRAYRDYAWFRILQALLQLAIGLLLYRLFPSYGLLMAYAVSQFLIGILILIRFRKHVTIRAWRHSIVVGRYFFRRACENSLVIAFQYSTSFAPVLVGYVFYTKADVGAYYLFAQVFSAPLAIFRRSFMSLLNAEAASPVSAIGLYREHRNKIVSYSIILIACFLTSSCVLIYYDRFFTSIFFGKSWSGYSNLLLPLFIFFFIDALLQPFTTLLTLWGFQRSAIKYEAARFCCVFVLVPMMVVSFDMSFYYYFVFYSLIMIFIYMLILMSVFRVTRVMGMTDRGGDKFAQ